MTRFIHDQFAKDYLEEFLKPYGEVKAPLVVRSERREIDVLFLPNKEQLPELKTLGLLGKMAQTVSIFEPFRNPVMADEIADCLVKSLEVRRSFQRSAKRKKRKFTHSEIPRLWIITPTVSKTILAEFDSKIKKDWLPGVYFQSSYFQSAIIVVHKLPKTPDTLWLRVLGREKVQQEAIGELEQLEDNSVLRSVTLELLYNLHDNLRSRQDLDKEDEELMMRLEPLYKKYRDEAVQEGLERGIKQGLEQGLERGFNEGRQQGRQQGLNEGLQQERRNTIENMLLTRFGRLDSELETIIEPLLALSYPEFAPLLSQLSREELLRRFRADN